MEFTGCSSWAQGSLISELTQGMELAKQLKAHMGPEASRETKGILVEKMISCYKKALFILKWDGGSMEHSHQHMLPSTAMPESPISVIGSPIKSDDQNRESSRKRKMMPSWTDQVKVSSENWPDGPPGDGYSWRKYGQKDILGAKHPRSYYRCTYRNIQGCYATKQVQRNEEDDSLIDITYKGTHTCTLAPLSKSTPTSPKKQKHNKQCNLPVTEFHQQPDDIPNFQPGLSVDTHNLENQETGFPFPAMGSGYENNTFTQSTINNFYGSFTPSFILSPATSATNCYPTSPSKMSTIGGVHHEHSKSDITDLMSATTSGTDFPIINIDFPPLDQLEFSPTFPFDNQAFFPLFPPAKQ